MLSQCPNCRATVSTRSVRCPDCHGPLRGPDRGSATRVFRWTFITFNVLMALWITFYLVTGRVTLHRASEIQSTTDAAGTPLAGNLGLGFLVMLWIAGGLILGLCAAFSLAHTPGRAHNGTHLSNGK